MATGRRWWSLSVRGLMALVLASGGLAGWYAHEVSARRAAWATIRAAGGRIAFRDEDPAAAGGWAWLYRRTGGDFCREVERIYLVLHEPAPDGGSPTPPPSDVTCAAIRRQGWCESVTIHGLPATEAGLAELAVARIDRLDLSLPNWTDGLLAQVRRMRHLKQIELGSSTDGAGRPRLPELIAAVAALRQIEAVELHGRFDRRAEDADLSPLSALTGLRELRLAPSPRDERCLAALEPLASLTSLKLEGTRLTDLGLARLATAHPRLRSLVADGAMVNDRGVEALAGLRDLEVLSLAPIFPAPDRPEPGHLADASLVALGGCRSLRELSLDHGHFTGAGLAALAGLPLTALDLDEMAEAGPGLARLVVGRTFERLTLRGPGVTDADLPALVGHFDPIFGRLDLTGVAVTDAGMPAFAGLKLQILTLKDTRITDRGLAALGAGLDARLLNIHGTDVTRAGAAAFRVACPQVGLLYVPPRPAEGPAPVPATPSEAPQ